MRARPPAPILLARLVVALLIAVAAGCTSESITAPSGSILTLSTTARSVSVNGTAVFTAQLLSSGGEPQVGTSIAFATTLGTIEPAEMVTNGLGQATAVFSVGAASGTAVVSASSGSVTANPVSLVVGTAAVGRVVLTASPAAVPFGGGSSTITAVVTDAAGNPLNATPVGFTTTSGTLTPANAKTDTNGIVQTTITTAAAAIVTAVPGSSPENVGALSSITGSVTIALAARPVPVVSIAASGNPVANSPITFTIGATPAPGTNTTIQNVSVDFGDGDRTALGAISGPAIVVQHIFDAGGTYTVSMTATDSAGGTATTSTVLVIQAAAPIVVSVVAGPMVPAGGGPKAIVPLTATVNPATAVITSYLWDFGDGTGLQRTTGNQVQHVFESAGLYTVTVTVTEALTDRTATGTVLVSTASGMPTVSIAASANPVAGRATTFTIAATAAPGSSATMQNVRVTFGDGSTPVDLGGVSGSAISVAHAYASAGTYLASVTATDSAGGTASASAQVVVAAPGAPSVSVAVTGNPVAGTATTFTITAAPAAGSNATIQNVQVTFGDTAAAVDLGPVNGTTTTQHLYAASGSYTVSAIATDSGGGTATAFTQVVVAAAAAPSVSVTVSANPVAGTPTTFTIAAAPAPGSNSTIQNVRVTFGDGSPAVDLGAVSNSTTQHVYAASGSYTVSVIATASNGTTATANTTLFVATAATISLAASPNSVAGTPTQFTVNVSPTAGVTIQNVTLRYGDGRQDDLGVVSGTPVVRSHTYGSGGVFVATVSVLIVGGSAPLTTSISVVVAACGPSAHTFSITSTSGTGLHAWPGGQQTFAFGPTCAVTVSVPTGTISNLSGDTWAIVSVTGYPPSSCTIAPRPPSCGGVGSSSGLLPNLRPYCSNAAATIFDNASVATALVECR